MEKKKYVNFIPLVLVGGLVSCAQVKIEPSDKPFIVNLNVKIDHEIRMKIEDQNQDIFNLENEVLKEQPKHKAPSKKGDAS